MGSVPFNKAGDQAVEPLHELEWVSALWLTTFTNKRMHAHMNTAWTHFFSKCKAHLLCQGRKLLGSLLQPLLLRRRQRLHAAQEERTV